MFDGRFQFITAVLLKILCCFWRFQRSENFIFRSSSPSSW